jgi:hypothetical protein
MIKLLFSIVFVLFSGVFTKAQNAEKIIIGAPEKVKTGETFIITIQLNSESFSSYHRLQLSFPQGFSFEVAEKGNAIIQQEAGNIKILWVSESKVIGEKISIQTKPSKTLNGTFRIPLELQYMENMQKVIRKFPSLDFLVVEKSIDTELSKTKSHVFDLNLSQAKTIKISSVENNSEYRVQLFLSSEALQIEWIAKQYGLKENEVIEEITDGKYLYTAGSFKSEAEAKKWLNSKEKIKSQGFLVKFVNGKIVN